MVYNKLKCSFQNICGMNETQIKLTLLSMFTVIMQGIVFYFIDKKGVKIKFFIFVILFGFFYNIVYYKTYL